MRLLLAFWALAGTPHLDGVPITVQQPDGTWKCSGVCLTDGNRDGGQCHALVPGRGATEDACKEDLKAKCANTKPPPGGCHWDGHRTGDK